MVENASDGFVAIQDNIDTLMQRVTDIDGKIKNLLQSNNAIIDSINHLSESSESVSDSAKEVESRSLQNQTEAEQAKELLNKVMDIEFEDFDEQPHDIETSFYFDLEYENGKKYKEKAFKLVNVTRQSVIANMPTVSLTFTR